MKLKISDVFNKMTASLICPPILWAKSGPIFNVPLCLILQNPQLNIKNLLATLVKHIWCLEEINMSGFPGYLL